MRYKAAATPRLRLFCFPYAGGAAHIFRQWPQGLPPSVEVCAVQPPGRGGRLRERPITSLRQLVAEAAPALRPYMDLPFAFFGHSMGAVVAFELAHHLRGARADGPAQLFVSGCRAPQLAREGDFTYNLPEPEFLAEIRRLKGTPPEVLEHPELLELVLPLLRADFTAIHTYEYSEVPPLTCPLTVFGGVEDEDVGVESLKAWRAHTTAAFTLRMLPGDHFFLHGSQPLLLEALNRDLRRLADTSP
ncbi:MAG TPA: alpha/beta fold hydrolase [Pyrinomonadaceae bacterium]